MLPPPPRCKNSALVRTIWGAIFITADVVGSIFWLSKKSKGFQMQLIFTTSDVRNHSVLWDNRSNRSSDP